MTTTLNIVISFKKDMTHHLTKFLNIKSISINIVAYIEEIPIFIINYYQKAVAREPDSIAVFLFSLIHFKLQSIQTMWYFSDTNRLSRDFNDNQWNGCNVRYMLRGAF
jgi:hypothetical protein